ncbi:hypothetical protein HN51_032226 [Arachis hypogaea]|uniref:cell wall / vacuolar inhibitor of fructosidase 2 n=1 Tax=Arachis hypogaea TaxID=3818 RepID=UPI000DED1675|nr:cell wall / vacuolar inhibitor of fructosidase 2 [Arachis hypogaea]QHO16527.1 Cell wall / vacuolar inhibitor of fructosidase [Arachis hypogaea]
MASKMLLLFLFFVAQEQYKLVKGDTSLIKRTCKNTKYYNLCFSSLKSDPSSPTADSKGLAVIMVGIAMTNATSTSSYLSSKLLSPKTNSTTLKMVLKECADKYSYAGDALQDSVQELSDENYDYAYMHISAAKDYPNACHNAFRRYPDLVYSRDLARREEGLKHICDVAMAIIDNLDW